MHKYRLLSKKGEGTFSEVLKAQSLRTLKYVALKCMKNQFESVDQVNNLREIQALRRLSGHGNIIKLHEVLFDEPSGRLALVFELMDMNVYEAIRGRRHYLPEVKVKHMMWQVVRALDHMHRNGIFHRDVKPENVLIEDDVVKLADFGSCRGVYSQQPYTEYISTRWYRAPECLLTDGYYTYKMDMFAIGCVWFEVIALFPLFPGTNEVDQISKIHNVLGTPSQDLLRRLRCSRIDEVSTTTRGTGIARLIPHVSTELCELLISLLKYDPEERTLARHVLRQPYFNGVELLGKQPQTGSSVSTVTSIDFEEPKPTHKQLHDASAPSDKRSLPIIESPQQRKVKKHPMQEQSKAQFKHAAASTFSKPVDGVLHGGNVEPSYHQSHHATTLTQFDKSSLPSYAAPHALGPGPAHALLPNPRLGKTYGENPADPSGSWGKPSYSGASSLMNTMTKKLAMTGQYSNFSSNANQTYHPHQVSTNQKPSYISPYSQRHVAR